MTHGARLAWEFALPRGTATRFPTGGVPTPASGAKGAEPRAPAIPLVFVVDDDVSVRESLELLIRSAGWQPELFESAHGFLERPLALMPSCLILDVAMPGLNGLELQDRIAAE